MRCTEIREQLTEASFLGEIGNAELREHVASCAECAHEWKAMQSTMRLLDTWEAPEPSPFFNTRLYALLEAEKQRPQSWMERLGLRLRWQPAAAFALVIAMAAGVTVYRAQVQPAQTPSIKASGVEDLKALEKNKQLLADLDALDDSSEDGSSVE
jgi:hypothetical protein